MERLAERSLAEQRDRGRGALQDGPSSETGEASTALVPPPPGLGNASMVSFPASLRSPVWSVPSGAAVCPVCGYLSGLSPMLECVRCRRTVHAVWSAQWEDAYGPTGEWLCLQCFQFGWQAREEVERQGHRERLRNTRQALAGGEATVQGVLAGAETVGVVAGGAAALGVRVVAALGRGATAGARLAMSARPPPVVEAAEACSRPVGGLRESPPAVLDVKGPESDEEMVVRPCEEFDVGSSGEEMEAAAALSSEYRALDEAVEEAGAASESGRWGFPEVPQPPLGGLGGYEWMETVVREGDGLDVDLPAEELYGTRKLDCHCFGCVSRAAFRKFVSIGRVLGGYRFLGEGSQ